MDQHLEAQLAELGLKYQSHTMIGHGGQLFTYLLKVVNCSDNSMQKVVLKRLQPEKNIVVMHGYKPEQTLQSEISYTELFSQKGLGPALLSVSENGVIRDYAEGDSLRTVIQQASPEKAPKHLESSLEFLEQILRLAEKGGLKGYIDFHWENILVCEDRKLSLIDHEWAILEYKTHEDQRVATISNYIKKTIQDGRFEFGEIFSYVRKRPYLEQHLKRVQEHLASGFFNNNNKMFQLALSRCSELQAFLTSRSNYATPISLLDQLCIAMKGRSIRYCFARRYDQIWRDGIYHEKDIDLFVHPDDHQSLNLLLHEIGFTICKHGTSLYYCHDTKQVVFLDVNLRGRNIPHPAFDVRQLASNAVERDGRRFISDDDLFLQLVVNALENRKKISGKYHEFLLRSVREKRINIPYVQRGLNLVLGETGEKAVFECILSESWEKLKHIRLTTFSTAPVMISFKERLRNRVVELMTRGPSLIAILGVDGAGKSTTVKLVRAALTDAKFSSINYYLGCYYPPSGRGQSFVLPTDWIMLTAFKALNWARKFKLVPRKLTKSKASPQKHGDKSFTYDTKIDEKPWVPPMSPGGECDSIIFRFYAWLLVFDCCLMAIKLRFSFGPLYVFTDRYFYDLITFLGKDHILSCWIARKFEPDAALFLYASPEIQAAREPRHPLSEIATNQSLYRAVPEINPKLNWHEVSTELPVDVVVQRVLVLCITAPRQRTILKLLNNMYRSICRRCGLLK